MRSLDRELREFLGVVGKVASSVAESPSPLGDAHGDLESAGLLALGHEVADQPDAHVWLAHTVRVAAESSPSLAFSLAARYAAQRATEPSDSTDAVFAVAYPGSAPVVPTALAPRTVVVLDLEARDVLTAAWSAVANTVEDRPRTGLGAARLRSFTPPNTPRTPGDPATILADWDIFTGAALTGLARRAVRSTADYVTERHQFGAPIASFMGLRALVADMAIQVDGLDGLLDSALDAGRASDRVSAVAGRVAVQVCIDAIQTHGGYGYITEYPPAGLLRDAVSLQARAGGRRLHVARIANQLLGPRGGAA